MELLDGMCDVVALLLEVVEEFGEGAFVGVGLFDPSYVEGSFVAGEYVGHGEASPSSVGVGVGVVGFGALVDVVGVVGIDEVVEVVSL